MTNYTYGMSTEEFDDIVTASYENGQFIPKYDEEINTLHKSQLGLTKRQELAVSQAQCQGECHS